MGIPNAVQDPKGDLEQFENAIEHFGGVTQLGLACEVTQPFVSSIRTGRRSISLELAIKIQIASEDQILASQLRPDLADVIKRAK